MLPPDLGQMSFSSASPLAGVTDRRWEGRIKMWQLDGRVDMTHSHCRKKVLVGLLRFEDKGYGFISFLGYDIRFVVHANRRKPDLDRGMKS